MGIEIFEELRDIHDTIVLQVSPSSIFREQINHLFRSKFKQLCKLSRGNLISRPS